jgi:hypothetical protein
VTIRLPALGFLFGLAACAGGGGSDDPTLVLDDALVGERITQVGAAVPGCDTTGAAVAAAVARVLRPPVALGGARQNPPPEATEVIASGACGGEVRVGSVHESGVTDYTIAFVSYCATAADGDVTLDGTVYGRQVGTPSDNGPVISAFEASTPSVVVSQNGQTIDLVVDGARVDYGNPAAWDAGEPDDTHPNQFAITEATATFSADGRKIVLGDFTMTGTGPYTAPILAVTGGRFGDAGEDFAVLSTPPDEPLVLDPLGLRISDGALVMSGAEDTSLRIDFDDNTAGVFTFTLDGTAFPTGLDCTAARGPLVATGLALLQGLAL